jgi:hypothetical protein
VLLKNVVLYHCLDCIWTQWDMKCKTYLEPIIHTTINQFETVVSSVITTSLGDQSMKDSDQAWVVEHWIEVARVFCKRPSQEGYHNKVCTIPHESPKD